MPNPTSKRKADDSHATADSSADNVLVQGILECYYYLAKNEYAEETIGIQAYLLRKSVGSTNYSDLIDESDKKSNSGQSADLLTLLKDRRKTLPSNEAAIEKCMIINRLIKLIEEDSQFTSLLSTVRLDVQLRMTDRKLDQHICFPEHFQRRVEEFKRRQKAQEKRRMFYFSNAELEPLPNLVYLQNRTTEQLNYVLEQINKNSKGRDQWTKQLENILETSFLIIAQPHCDVNPTTIYERKSAGLYTAKISVFIVSLLHDFMRQNPNFMELYDIEPSLCPTSDLYRMDEPQTLPWRTYEFRVQPNGSSLLFKCAEMSSFTIGQASKQDPRVRFAQGLHTFKFAIKIRFSSGPLKNLTSKQIVLESLPFGIGAHNNQIPQLLTRLLLDDIQRFSGPSRKVDSRIVQDYVRRYFIHRTGVQPQTCVMNFLEHELNRAASHGGSNLEDTYLDFLVHFVQQVEFMAKHPILSIFHADKIFLGICHSERAAEAIVQTCAPDSPVIGLRFNSIRVEHSSASNSNHTHRTIRTNQCAVRVDIYNDRTKKLQNRTFDSASLAHDIGKFVLSSRNANPHSIRILSYFDDKTNARGFLEFNYLIKYSDDRLHEISKSDEKYKPVTDLVDNATDISTDEPPESVQSEVYGTAISNPNSVQMMPPLTPQYPIQEMTSDLFGSNETYSQPVNRNVNYANGSSNFSPSNLNFEQINKSAEEAEMLKKLMAARPDIVRDMVYERGMVNMNIPPMMMNYSNDPHWYQQQQNPMMLQPNLANSPDLFQARMTSQNPVTMTYQPYPSPIQYQQRPLEPNQIRYQQSPGMFVPTQIYPTIQMPSAPVQLQQRRPLVNPETAQHRPMTIPIPSAPPDGDSSQEIFSSYRAPMDQSTIVPVQNTPNEIFPTNDDESYLFENFTPQVQIDESHTPGITQLENFFREVLNQPPSDPPAE